MHQYGNSNSSLVIGMGIGNLYADVLKQLGREVVTVDSDPNKKATYTNVQDAIHGKWYGTVHICTPNFTHEPIAKLVAGNTDIVFVEKPGFENANRWYSLVSGTKTRVMMVKNNQWRENIEDLRALANRSATINLNWINRDRVPSPGTWFTTKELAFGGVSRDLMPHLLSLFIELSGAYKKAELIHKSVHQRWHLYQLTNTEYGKVKADGIYNVDDVCDIQINANGKRWNLFSDWRSLGADKRCINFVMHDGSVETFELGLCPEEAYRNMIQNAIANKNNNDFWQHQVEQDLWIHEQIQFP